MRTDPDPMDWIFLAMTLTKLGEGDEALGWYEKTKAWMDAHPEEGKPLEHWFAEAAKILGR